MTPEHAKKILPIITAFANGERVQFYNGKHWEDGNDLNFESRLEEYRIAPKSEDAEWLRKFARCDLIRSIPGHTIIINSIADKLERMEGESK